MAVELVMPRLSDSMEEGTVVSWLVPDGSPVLEGQEIAEIETDKATMPYEAPEPGVLRILVPEGTTLPLGQPIGLIDDLSPLAATAPEPTWSPAWGPQPVAQTTQGFPDADAEGETTEFAALDVRVAAPDPEIALAQDATTEAAPGLAPQTVVAAPAPAAAPASLSPFGAPAAAPQAIPVGPPPAAPAASPVPAPAPEPAPVETHTETETGEHRYAADELVAPATLPPRPPELRAAAGPQRIAASPVARRLAGELGIDLAALQGTGPEGRIVRADIEAAQATGAARPPLPASAAPTTASEFTPVVDEARAAAPIPAADPGDELEEAIDPTPAEETAPAVEPEPEPHDQPTTEHAAVSAAEATTPASEPMQPELTGLGPATPEHSPPPFEAVVPAPGAPVHEALHAVEPEPLPAPEEQFVEEIDPTASEETAPAPATAEPEPAPPEPSPSDPGPEPAAATAAPEPAATPEPAAATEPEPASGPAPAETRVMAAAQAGGGKGEPTVTELSRQAQTVARRMAESKATIPDFHTTVEVDAAPLLGLQSELRTNRPDLTAPSVNDLLVKAVAIALRAFPKLNGAYRDGRLEQYPRVNIGIATDTGGVLLVPVIHDADHLSVSQIAARTDEVLEKARTGALRPPDIASATFTLSNLGMYGVDTFTAVITPGQAAILTAGAIAERAVVRGGAIVPGQTLNLTLTTDHRAVYGLEAAQFLARVRQLIEHPTSLLA